MELDDLKNDWEAFSNQAGKQQNLHFKIIDEMTSNKYHSKLRRITLPEITGGIICFAAAAFIGFNFSKLDTAFMQGTAIVSLLLLLILPVISIIILLDLTRVGDVNKTYAETLKQFAVQKIRFHKFQRVNVTLSYLLLVTVILLLPKFFAGKDISGNKYFWIFSFTFGYIFLLFFSKWVSKYYNNTLRKAEELLKELES